MKLMKTVIIAAIVLFVLFTIISLSLYFFQVKASTYRIENKYYGFQLQSPKGWITEKNMNYYDENIVKILEACKNDNYVYEVGGIKIESQRYPQDLINSGNFSEEIKTGAILEVSVSCVLDNKINDKMKTSFIELSGFGKTKMTSLFHGDFQYDFTEYVYVAPVDRDKESQIRKEYEAIMDKIVSSFNFTK